jgi:glutathione S-transferase
MTIKGKINWEIAVPTIMAALLCYYIAGPIGFMVAMAAGIVWHAIAEENAKTSAQLDALRDQLEAIREIAVSNARTLSTIETRVVGTKDTIADQFHMEELDRLTPEQRARIDELLDDSEALRAYLGQLEREGAFAPRQNTSDRR